jgi:putative DNA primase/helicase
VDGGKRGSRDGAYKGHLDGHPAGYIENFVTGHRENWKSQGFSLSEDERQRLRAEAMATLEKRQKEREEAYETIAFEAKQTIRILPEAPSSNAYLSRKGLAFNHGALTDPSDSSLVLPATDVDGKVWTFQKIHGDGTKSFAPNGKMAGCMFVARPSSLNGLQGTPAFFLNNALSRPQIFIAEGYATAASLSEALNMPVIAAFSSGNLAEVANAIRKKAPNAEIVICGDDDQATEMKRGKNPGREKALAAAEAVKGKAVFPVFSPGTAKASDFNDLHQGQGLDAIKRQITAALSQKKEIKLKVEKTRSMVIRL